MSYAAAAAHVAGYCCSPLERNFEPYTPDDDFGLLSVHEPPDYVLPAEHMGWVGDALDEVGVITPRVSIDRVNELDAQVERLDEGARQHFGVPPKPNPDHPLGIWPWLQDWDIFLARWKVWRVEHESELSRIGDEPVTEFVAFKSEFNQLLERADAEGVDSSASPVPEGHVTPEKTAITGLVGLGLLALLAFGIGYALHGVAGARRTA